MWISPAPFSPVLYINDGQNMHGDETIEVQSVRLVLDKIVEYKQETSSDALSDPYSY